MKLRKAVITAAAPAQRDLPLQTLVDTDGERKSVLCLQIAEMVSAGAEEVCVIVAPGTEQAYRQAAASHADRTRFIVQEAPRGYGDALYCAKEFLAGEAFLHQVGDHVFVRGTGTQPAAAQIAAVAEEADCSVSGVQATRETLLTAFGTIGGVRVSGTSDRYKIERVAEKPTPTEAEQSLIIPGLRAGHYLCFMGTHAFTPLVLDLLEEAVTNAKNGEKIGLTSVLNRLLEREPYLAIEATGKRYHLDTRYGLLSAQLALALSGDDRDTVLTELIGLLAATQGK